MFPDTPWTLIAAATLRGDDEGRAALERFCGRYYEPVRRFICWCRRDQSDVDDLVQAFFQHLCDRSVVRRADRARGKFRTFIISVLKNFLANKDRAQMAEKRGGNVEPLPLEEAMQVEAESHDPQFDREWALSLMNAALAQVCAELDEARGTQNAQVLKLFLSAQHTAPSYEAAAQTLGMTTAAVKMEVMRWRRHLGDAVRREIARTVSAPHEVEEELMHLRRVLLT